MAHDLGDTYRVPEQLPRNTLASQPGRESWGKADEAREIKARPGSIVLWTRPGQQLPECLEYVALDGPRGWGPDGHDRFPSVSTLLRDAGVVAAAMTLAISGSTPIACSSVRAVLAIPRSEAR